MTYKVILCFLMLTLTLEVHSEDDHSEYDEFVEDDGHYIEIDEEHPIDNEIVDTKEVQVDEPHPAEAKEQDPNLVNKIAELVSMYRKSVKDFESGTGNFTQKIEAVTKQWKEGMEKWKRAYDEL